MDRAEELETLKAGFRKRIDADLETIQHLFGDMANAVFVVFVDDTPDATHYAIDTAIEENGQFMDGMGIRVRTKNAPESLTRDLPQRLTFSDLLRVVQKYKDEFVIQLATALQLSADLLIKPKYRRAVIMGRDIPARVDYPPILDDSNPLHEIGSLLRTAINSLEHHNSAAYDVEELTAWHFRWPGDAAPARVVEWALPAYKKLLNPENAAAIQERVANGSLPPTCGGRVDGVLIWITPNIAAHLYLAEQEAIASARKPTFPVSINNPARASLEMLGAPEWQWRKENGKIKYRTTESDIAANAINFEIVWPSRKRPAQLKFQFPNGDNLPLAVLQGILANEEEDGLRDWLTLFKMAGEQGGSGQFTWSATEHAKIAGYDARRQRRQTELSKEEIARNTVERLWRLKRTEIRLTEKQPDGTTRWVRIGDGGLIDIPAGIDDKHGATAAALVKINPAIYAGAQMRGPGKGTHFTPFPDEMLRLPGPSLRLYTNLMVYMADKRDRLEEVVFDARALLDLAGVDPAGRKARKLAALNNILLDLRKTGWEFHEGTGAGGEPVYKPTAPTWWQDRALHGVTPEQNRLLPGTPKTGAELLEWRNRHGLSQHGAALALAAQAPQEAERIKKAIQRAEGRPSAMLPRSLLEMPWHAGTKHEESGSSRDKK